MTRRKRIAIACATVVAVMVLCAVVVIGKPARVAAPAARSTSFVANDSHLHLTNYIQEGPPLASVIDNVLGDQIGRAALFGIPLQQKWSFRTSGSDAPTYYLESDDDLYYYSFTDAYIAMAYRGLTPAQRARIDP